MRTKDLIAARLGSHVHTVDTKPTAFGRASANRNSTSAWSKRPVFRRLAPIATRTQANMVLATVSGIALRVGVLRGASHALLHPFQT